MMQKSGGTLLDTMKKEVVEMKLELTDGYLSERNFLWQETAPL